MQTSTIQWIPQGETRVPLAVYRDDQVFADEQRNIYRGDTWNYLCLENENKVRYPHFIREIVDPMQGSS